MAYKEDVLVVSSTKVEHPFTEEAVGFIPGTLTVTVEDQNVRFWISGREPTTSEGLRIFANGGAVISSPAEIMNMKLIAESSTAKINYSIKGR